MKGDYLVLAFKNLRHRGIRSWLTLLGIIIGVTAVITLISLGTGLKMAVGAQFGISTTEVLTVQAGGISGMGPPGSGVTKPLTTDDVEAISRLSEVDIVIPRNIETVKMEFNNKLKISYAASIPDGLDRNLVYSAIDVEIDKGRLLGNGDSNSVVLGSGFSNGDTNGFEKAIEIGDKVTINSKKFNVAGILKKKGSFIIDNAILMNNQPLKDLTGYGDNVDVIAVKVKSSDLMDKAKTDIENVLRKERGVKKGEEDFQVSTPEAMLETVNSILGGVEAFIIIIASISIIVGAIGIVNTMTTSVLERKKEIGIMKSIGAKNSQVFLQFFIESGLLGLIGGLTGVILGSALGALGVVAINGFIGGSLSPSINFVLVASTLVGSFVIGSIAGIAPAMRAANQNPVEALRD